MTFIRTVNGVLNSRYIVRAFLSREHSGYATVQYINSDWRDEHELVHILCKVEELERIGISLEDLGSRPCSEK